MKKEPPALAAVALQPLDLGAEAQLRHFDAVIQHDQRNAADRPDV